MSKHPLRIVFLAGIVSILGSGLAVAQDEIFVTNGNNNSVTVYSRTVNGNVAPVRTLVGAAPGLDLPQGVAVDLVNNELWVVNRSTGGGWFVAVYPRTANGNVAPLRTISGAATGLNSPISLAISLGGVPPTPCPPTFTQTAAQTPTKIRSPRARAEV